jgi:hypothetical protein
MAYSKIGIKLVDAVNAVWFIAIALDIWYWKHATSHFVYVIMSHLLDWFSSLGTVFPVWFDVLWSVCIISGDQLLPRCQTLTCFSTSRICLLQFVWVNIIIMKKLVQGTGKYRAKCVKNRKIDYCVLDKTQYLDIALILFYARILKWSVYEITIPEH